MELGRRQGGTPQPIVELQVSLRDRVSKVHRVSKVRSLGAGRLFVLSRGGYLRVLFVYFPDKAKEL